MENGTDKNVRTVIFDNAKELIAGQMKELCNERSIQIISPVPYSPSPNSVATNGSRTVQDSLLNSGRRQWGHSCTCRIAPMVMNTLYELVYRINLDVEHMYLQMHGEGQRVKSNAPIEFRKWVNLMENCTDKNVRTVIFNNAKELVAGRMKELCNKPSIRIILSVSYSPPPNSVATNGTWAISHGSGLLRDPGQR